MRRSLTAATPRSDPRPLSRCHDRLARARNRGGVENGRVRVRPLDETTWPDFARAGRAAQRRVGRLLVHGLSRRGRRAHETAAQNGREGGRVREGRAHAALVYDGRPAWAGASSGRPTNCRASSAGARTSTARRPPDWRITCFFVDQAYRRRGVAAAALDGARARSRGSAAARWRAIPRTPKTGRFRVVPPQRDRVAVRAPRLRADAPPRQSITGWSAEWCAEPRRVTHAPLTERRRRARDPLLEGARLLPAETLIDAALRPRSGCQAVLSSVTASRRAGRRRWRPRS